MRILFVSGDFGMPARTGPQRQTILLLKYLLSEGNQCALLALSRPGITVDLPALDRELPGLKVIGLSHLRHRYAAEVLIAMFGSILRPRLLFDRFNGKAAFESALRSAAADSTIDIAHFEAITVSPYLRWVSRTPVVYSHIDSLVLRQRRMAEESPSPGDRIYRRIMARVAPRFERSVLSFPIKVHVVSEIDRDYLKSLAPDSDIECIPLAVPESDIALGRATDEASPRLFISGELYGYLGRGNLWFLKEVYPRVLAHFPGLPVTIVAKGDPVAGLAEEIARYPQVTLHQWVDDYQGELRKAQVAIAADPCGTGLKNRVLTAMALGRPVVGTPIAFEGIPIRNGVEGFCAADAPSFANAIVGLLSDSTLRSQMAKRANAFVAERYAMQKVGAEFLRLYQSAVVKFQAASGKTSTNPSSDSRAPDSSITSGSAAPHMRCS